MMCVGDDCGRYRIYTIGEMFARQMWLGTDPTVPANPADILLFPQGLTNPKHEQDANRHYRDGLGKKWRAPVHVGDKCPGSCRCVKTDEKVGGMSETETRVWRQPVILGTSEYVISGTYSLKFQDYRATCDDGGEEGDPVVEEEQGPERERHSL